MNLPTAKTQINMVEIEGMKPFLKRFKAKLLWGEDKRN
jgi:hypothetical protein